MRDLVCNFHAKQLNMYMLLQFHGSTMLYRLQSNFEIQMLTENIVIHILPTI